ncbi:MAG: HAD hydrolase-like protein [Dehalococcoidales bacterium]|nr:HAD hydrolase-like protein [Dehalococcoidales bacterium]
MIQSENVNLLIFDLDGTISVTTKPVYHAVQKAFSNLGISLELSPEEMEHYFGAPSPAFYQALAPSDGSVSWQIIKEEIHKEQPSSFREFGETYPAVFETLELLRKRDYKLALFSNSTPGYFDPVISALGIGDCFDYKECIGENNLTKTELAGKIINLFGSPGAAVVGDRIHDIQAARENNALSIGALYGYGNREPLEADITIREFTDLLDIFDRRQSVFKKLLNEITVRKQEARPIITGITGIDASGKTEFTLAFKEFLENLNVPVQLVHLDDFHNPMAYRYSGESESENYYTKSFNLDTIINKLLIPIKEKGNLTAELTLLNLETDAYDTKKYYNITYDTIVLFEGVFLLRKELRPYIDYTVFLEIPLSESKTRALIRDSETVLSKYDTKYTPAQEKYLRENPPEKTADIIIDNLNWDHPRIISL